MVERQASLADRGRCRRQLHLSP